MASTDVHSIYEFPPELLLQVVQHLSFRDHARWLLADRQHRVCLSPILYLRLLPFKTDPPDSDGDATQCTQKDVVRWAVEHGRVSTLKNVDEVEDLAPFLGTTLTSTAAGLALTPIHQAALCGHALVIEYLMQKGADVNASTTGTNGLLPLHLAKTGAVVHLLASYGGWLDRDTTPSGLSALTSSIVHGCEPSAVTAFLRLGANPNHVAQDGSTAAEVAIATGNVAALGILLDAGVDANQSLPTGGSLLYKAVWLGGRDHGAEVVQAIATMLLDRGACPNSSLDAPPNAAWEGERSHTPTLFLAVMMPSSADLVQLLLERGADQHEPFTTYRDRFYAQAKTLRGFEEAYAESLVANLIATMTNSVPYPPDPDGMRTRKLKLLLEYGGNIDATIRDKTLLQYCLSQNGSRSVRGLETIPTLLQLGADATVVDPDGNSTLHLLCGPFVGRVQQYWGAGPSNWYNKRLWPSPLAPLVDGLVARGADLNARDTKGRTPLMLLCRHPHTIPTALLIDVLLRHRGVNATAVNNSGANALHYATGDPADPFHDDPCFRLQVLLNRGGEGVALGVRDVNAYSAAGRTPLHLLLEARDKDPGSGLRETQQRMRTKARALVMLLRAGADARARTRLASEENLAAPGSEGGESPLHLALRGHPLEMLMATRLLLRHGAAADVNYVSPGAGRTPLMMVASAAGRGELSRNTAENMVGLLVAAGADVQLRDATGHTAWDVFVELKGPLPSISPWAMCLRRIAPN